MMKFISTTGKSEPVSFMKAIRQGLAPDGGLYMPDPIPVLPDQFWSSLHTRSFPESAFELARLFLKDEVEDSAVQNIVENAFDFPVELTKVENDIFILELFHGPTLAFKDFGARFMARAFALNAAKTGEQVTILVATSGDTGSAVANAFYKVDGVRVCLLYPKGKVSHIQEKQMTTLGGNITVLEVKGVFDDCQRLVKKAFTDPDLSREKQLSSANSINIARLLPQSFYYMYAAGELKRLRKEAPVYSVPSGNFGNLTGGLMIQKMGLKFPRMLAATNRNNVVPKYLNGEPFRPAVSVQTISNAMDVGNPSNFARMQHLFNHSDEELRNSVSGYYFSDDETRKTIRSVYKKTGYILDPHTAVGYKAVQTYKEKVGTEQPFVVLGTAHPVKFKEIVEKEIRKKIELPDQIKASLQKEKKAIPIGKNFSEFKSLLLDLPD